MEVGPEIAATLYDHMASDLRNLVVSQELYFSDNNAYGRVLSATSKRQAFIRQSPGVTLRHLGFDLLRLEVSLPDVWPARHLHHKAAPKHGPSGGAL